MLMSNTPDESAIMTPLSPTYGIDHQALLAKALASTGCPAFIADYRSRIVWVNHAFIALSGYAESELLGMPASVLRDGKRDALHYAQAWGAVQRGHEWRNEVVDAHRNGTRYTFEEIITPLLDNQGAITHFFVLRHDVTQRSHSSAKIQHLADHDDLTGLLNRNKFRSELTAAIAQAGLDQQLLATLFIDLDHFKPVNDKFGHHIGDLLLETVANRLRGAVRNGDVIARCGGDEFAVLLKEMPDAPTAEALAKKLVAALAKPFTLLRHKVKVTASIGIAIFPQDGDTARALLIKADGAMYEVKHSGGNGVKTCENR